MRLASSSFTNARLAGSQVTLRPSWHAMYAQWEVTWALQVDSALARGSDRERMQSSQFWMWRGGSVARSDLAQLARDVRAMGGDVGVTGGLGVGARQRPGADAVQPVLDVAGGIGAAHRHRLVVGAEIVGHFHLAGIPRLDPAFGPFEAHAARTQVQPAVAAEDEFHAVGVGAVYMAGARLRIVLDRVSVVAIGGPLADVAGVGGPLQNPGMEVPELAPSAIRVAGVIRAPRTWNQPLVPIEDQRIGLWPFFGPPTVAQRSEGPRPIVGMHGQQFAELAAAGQPHREFEVGDVAALAPGLVDHPITADIFGQREAFRDGDGGGLLAVDVLAGLRRPDRHAGVPAVAGGDHDGFDIFAGQQFRVIAVDDAVAVSIVPINRGLDGLARGFPDIGDADKLNPRIGEGRRQILLAAVAEPAAAADDSVAGRHNTGLAHRLARLVHGLA